MKAQPDILTLENYSQWRHRWERRCLPYRRLTVRAALPSEEIKARIGERLFRPRWFMSVPLGLRELELTDSTRAPKFRGTINGDRFKLRPRYLSQMNAVINGRIEQKADGGTEVTLLVRANLFLITALVLSFMFGIAMALTALVIGIAEGWTAIPDMVKFFAAMDPLLIFAYKAQVCVFFRHAADVPVFFSSVGNVEFE